MADPYIVAENGCWIWQLSKDVDGYGKIKVFGRSLRAHRVFWERKNGAIPGGLLLCHRCDTPSCVNPDHLFLGDHKTNHRDRGDKGRTASGERHGRAKLTLADVKFIRENRPGYRAAATQFGIGKTHYHRILRGQAWR